MTWHLSWTVHISVLLAVLAPAAVLAALLRRYTAWRRAIRFSLGGFLAANELVWYAYRLHEEGLRFPEALPLQLCDLTLWLTVVAALTLKQRVYETAYFLGLGGSSMALFTPDLWAPFPSYPTVYFFLSHGFVVATLLALTGGGVARPQPGCVWRTFAIGNVYTAGIGVFNAVFKTNYMYLRSKPANPSLLDYFGPWPTYILTGEVFALAVFWLLWLPVRRSGRSADPH